MLVAVRTMEDHGVVRMLRDIQSRQNARVRYLSESNRLQRMADDLARDGRVYESAGARYWSLIARRAADAEKQP